MTEGEKMIWAAVFAAERRRKNSDLDECLVFAADTILLIRQLAAADAETDKEIYPDYVIDVMLEMVANEKTGE